MKHLTLFHPSVNPGLLHQELKVELGEIFIGLSLAPEKLIIHVDETISDEQGLRVTQIVDAHDGTLKSESELDALSLAADRDTYSAVLDPTKVTLEGLASRVQWLEAELRRMIQE